MFSKVIFSEIEVRASATAVWKILTEFDSYPDWNPYIRSIVGSPIREEKLEIQTQPPGSRKLRFKGLLLTVEPNKELRWRGSFLPHLLFVGEHTFSIQELDRDHVKFVQNEVFTGLLTPLLRKRLDERTMVGFRQMNEALKVRAETDRPVKI
jgi:hypothetical protein